MGEIEFRWATPDAEGELAYMARGSNPPNQDNPEFEKLFRYCLDRFDVHWSVLQMCNMVVGIKTSLFIAAQFKRHWSLACHGPEDLQETSFRYMSPTDYDWGYEPIELRYQATKNRQSSTDAVEGAEKKKLDRVVQDAIDEAEHAYRVLLGAGVARECARSILPTATTTRFYVNGTARSWSTYFIQRLSPHAQLEHQQLAMSLFEHFERHYPTVCKILFKRVDDRVVVANTEADKYQRRIAELEKQLNDALAQMNFQNCKEVEAG